MPDCSWGNKCFQILKKKKVYVCVGTIREQFLQPKTETRFLNERKSLTWSWKVVCGFSFLPRQANKVSLAPADSRRVHTDSRYQSLSATCRLRSALLGSRGVVYGLGALSGRWAGRRCCLSGNPGPRLFSILHNNIWTAPPWPAPGLPLAPDGEFRMQDKTMGWVAPVHLREIPRRRGKNLKDDWTDTLAVTFEMVQLDSSRSHNAVEYCKIWNWSSAKHSRRQYHRYSLIIKVDVSPNCQIWMSFHHLLCVDVIFQGLSHLRASVFNCLASTQFFPLGILNCYNQFMRKINTWIYTICITSLWV